MRTHKRTPKLSPIQRGRTKRVRHRDGETGSSHRAHETRAKKHAAVNIPAARRAQRAIAGTADAPIRMIRIRKESDHTLHYLVTVELGHGRSTTLIISVTSSLGQIAKAIGSVSEDLSSDPDLAKEQIAELIAAAPNEIITAIEFGGWKNGETYVGPNLRRGRSFDRYVWIGASAPAAGNAKGTLGGWRKEVAALCAESSYFAFALLVALAGPVLYWAELPEGAVFHVAGESSTGETTTARIAASIDGAPGSHAAWNLSDCSFAETIAARCDRVAIFNAAENAKLNDMREILAGIVHGSAEGGSKKYSAAVKTTLTDLLIRSTILSNGNRSGAEMARIAGLAWAEREAARFITIPVPPREAGGIVDRPMGTAPGYSTELIERLEHGMKRHHGRVMSRWLDYVWANRGRVNNLIKDFIEEMKPADAFKSRVAAKFGLIFATGTIAVESGFLPWNLRLPMRVVQCLYRRALIALQEGCPVEALVALREALDDPTVFPAIGAAKELILDDDRVAGFRFCRAHGDFVAIRQESLSAVLGQTTEPSVLIRALEEAGVIEDGHGARRSKQLHVRLINRTNGRVVAKPRCLVMTEAALAAFLETAGRGRRADDDAIVIN